MSQDMFEGNELLKTVDQSARARFSGRFQQVRLRRGEVVHNQGEPVDRVYFPIEGLVAVISETLAGESVQTGMVGCDGAIGAFEATGSGHHLAKGVVQIAGVALRTSAATYRDMVKASPDFRLAGELYIERLLMEARQFMACNAMHPVENRLSRSILETLDRACLGAVLPLTQETLAQMLGAQRTTVAVFLSKMQRAGLLKNGRGAIEVRDRQGLERLACSCRKTLRLAQADIPALAHTRRAARG
jgi:CRP-like cAMP-binding protein